MWKLNNTQLPMDSVVKGDDSRGIRRHFGMNEKEKTPYEHLWDAKEAVIVGPGGYKCLY